MGFIILGIIFVGLLFLISLFLKATKSRTTKKVIRFGVAAIFGGLAVFLVFRGIASIGGILAVLSFLSAQGGLWRFLGGPQASPDQYGSKIFDIPMTHQEALEILELFGTPTDSEIKHAYHKMLMKNHTDHDGSDFYAAKLTLARDTLLD